MDTRTSSHPSGLRLLPAPAAISPQRNSGLWAMLAWFLLAGGSLALAAPRDYFTEALTADTRLYFSPGGGLQTIPGENGPFTLDYWNLPAVVRPGQVVQSSLGYTIGASNAAGSVVYKTVLAEWNTNAPVATLESGELQGSPRAVRKEFSFTAPASPGTYRLRLAMVWAFQPITQFFGNGPAGDSANPGVGHFAEVTLRVEEPPVTDHFLDAVASGSRLYLSPQGGAQTIPGENAPLRLDYWNLPKVVRPGQTLTSSLAYTIQANNASGSVVYKHILAEWNTNTPIAVLESGESQGSPRTVRKEFSFTAPVTPGTYRVRLAMTWAFQGIQKFYGDGPAGNSSTPGVGHYAELVLRVESPLETCTEEAFAVDPNWTTDDPTKLRWDAGAQSFHGTQVNTEGTYAYTSLPNFNPNKPWRLQFDHIINSCDWSAGLTVGLFDDQTQYPHGAGMDMGIGGAGNATGLWGGGGAASLYSPAWQPGVWYRTLIWYDPATQALGLHTVVRSNNAFFMSQSRTVASFSTNTTRLGVSRLHMKNTGPGATPSATVDYFLDNVQLCTSERDYFLEALTSGSRRYFNPGGGENTIPGEDAPLRLDYWNVPESVVAGQSFAASLGYTVQAGNAAGSVVYKHVLAEWNTNSPLTVLESGEAQGSPHSVRKEFSFVAPSTPGTYRLRLAMTWAFQGIQKFYGDGPAGDSFNPGVGHYAEVSVKVLAPSAAAGKLIYTKAGPPERLELLDIATGEIAEVPVPVSPVIRHPRWHPSGEWLIFNGGPGGDSQIFTSRPDGTGFRSITTGYGNRVDPAVSADGNRIAFHEVYGTVWLVNFDGTGLTNLGLAIGSVSWSPDGGKLVGTDWALGGGYNSDLWIYTFSNAALTKLTTHAPGSAYTQSSWSPDGSKIAATYVNPVGGKVDIMLINADGTGETNLTADLTGSNQGGAHWTPDGQFILYVSDENGDYDVWSMKPDGTSRTRLTTTSGDKYGPASLSPLQTPCIVAHPIGLTAGSGANAQLSVDILGGGQLFYQWQFNGANLPGANSASLDLANLAAAQAGTYTVIVSNAFGSVISQSAVVSLTDIDIFAGLIIAGPVGANYRIDYRTDLNTNWMTLTNFALPTSPYIYVDVNSAGQEKRFYRSVLLP